MDDHSPYKNFTGKDAMVAVMIGGTERDGRS